MFTTHQIVVAPGHGLGKIERIETRMLGSNEKQFYVVQLISSPMKIMVAFENKSLRALVDRSVAQSVFSILSDHSGSFELDTWNKRYHRFQESIRSGDIVEIAKVYRELMLTKKHKTLSFGERKVVDQVESLVVQELSYVLQEPAHQIQTSVRNFFN